MGEKFQILIFKKQKFKNNKINFDTKLVSRTIGIDVKDKDIIKILNKLGFETKKSGKNIETKFHLGDQIYLVRLIWLRRL